MCVSLSRLPLLPPTCPCLHPLRLLLLLLLSCGRDAVLAEGHTLALDPNAFVVLPESAAVAQ